MHGSRKERGVGEEVVRALADGQLALPACDFVNPTYLISPIASLTGVDSWRGFGDALGYSCCWAMLPSRDKNRARVSEVM